MISEKPIIFNQSMVKAILEGHKIQTRRPIRNQPDEDGLVHVVGKHGKLYHWYDTSGKSYTCPFHKKGMDYKDSILWVKETWATVRNVDKIQDFFPYRNKENVELNQDGSIYSCTMYRADGEIQWCDDDGFLTDMSKWSPSIHMPQWASRITLKVKKVWVERLSDMKDDDWLHEGMEVFAIPESYEWEDGVYYSWPDNKEMAVTDEEMFQRVWDSIYSDELSFNADPWVWACEFEVVK